MPTVTFSVTFDDPGGGQSEFYSDLEQNMLAAGAELAKFVNGNSSIEVVIGFSETAPTANGGSEAVVFLNTANGISYVQAGGGNEIKTGVDANGAAPDVRITIGIDYLTDEVWLDPTPFSGADPVPVDKVDGYSVLLHELVHAVSFIGYGDDVDGSLPSGFATLFDKWVTFEDDNFFFNGPNAIEAYGGPVPLTFGNHFHVANNPPRPGSDLLPDLMNGVIGYLGVRDVISEIDLAIIADTDIPLLEVQENNPPDIAPQTFEVAEHSPNGAFVGTVVATDVDAGQTRTFAITSGNAAGAFSIDAATGTITVADGTLLEVDDQETHVLVVEVTDNGAPALSDSASITINLFERTVPQVATSPGATTLGKGTTVIVDAAAELESGPDFTDPDGTTLTVAITSGRAAKDQLVIAGTGDKASKLKLKKGELKKGKTLIATTTGGTEGSTLEISFLSAASVADIELVLKSVALKCSRKNVGSRTIDFQFYLFDGATGTAATKEVVVP